MKNDWTGRTGYRGATFQWVLTKLGFSLIEVVLSLGIVSFVLVALLGLLSVGMGSLRDSNIDTVTGMIFRDVRARLMGETFTPSLAPMVSYYDRSGTLLDQSKPEDVLQNFYRVQVTIQSPAPLPAGTVVGSVLSTAVSVSWPAATVANGTVTAGAQTLNKASASFLISTDSTATWTTLDPEFQALIAF